MLNQYIVISELTGVKAKPHDATFPPAATVATALTLASCSGTRQVCHGNKSNRDVKTQQRPETPKMD